VLCSEFWATLANKETLSKKEEEEGKEEEEAMQ
jgi:hypothetical protein